MSYALRNISNKDIYEGKLNIDRFKLNTSSRVIDSHNNYKLVCTPVMKGNKPVLNHFGNPLKVYEIIKYTCDKSGVIYVRAISLPIYGYLKAIEQFEYIRINNAPTAWQEQYYKDRPHLFECTEGKWHRKDYEIPTVVKKPKINAGTTKTNNINQKSIKSISPAIDPKREDKIRKAINKAVKEKIDVTDVLSDEDFSYAIKYMNMDVFNVTKWRNKHPLTNEPIY